MAAVRVSRASSVDGFRAGVRRRRRGNYFAAIPRRVFCDISFTSNSPRSAPSPRRARRIRWDGGERAGYALLAMCVRSPEALKCASSARWPRRFDRIEETELEPEPPRARRPVRARVRRARQFVGEDGGVEGDARGRASTRDARRGAPSRVVRRAGTRRSQRPGRARDRERHPSLMEALTRPRRGHERRGRRARAAGPATAAKRGGTRAGGSTGDGTTSRANLERSYSVLGRGAVDVPVAEALVSPSSTTTPRRWRAWATWWTR